MSTLFAMLAQSTTPTTVPVDRPWWTAFFENPLWMMVAILIIFYFVMMRSKRTQERQREGMLKQLKKGDRVQTIGGILGTVVDAREHEVVVKVDESTNAKIKFARSAIHRVLGEETKP